MIRYQRHTGPISHPVIDPPEDLDVCRSCGLRGEGVICDQCDQFERDEYEREQAKDCEGDDP